MRTHAALYRPWPTGCIVLLAILVAPVNASISQTVFSIQAENDSGSAALAIDFSDGVWDPVDLRYTWQLPGALPLVDGSDTIATLNSAGLTIEFQPVVSIDLTFGVQAGTTDTTFLIDSAIVNFATVPAGSAEGAFLAGCTVVDSGAGNGMWLYEPGLAGFGAFQAYMNVQPGPATIFSDLLALVGSFSGGTANASEAQPSSGYNPIAGAVHDTMVRANFVLTHLDNASANATFSLVPEPTAVMLMSVGAFFFGRRRTHR